MMDIGSFRDLFSSLSRISDLIFEIWNRQGFLFSSKANGRRTPNREEIRELSKRIMDQDKFLHRSAEDEYTLFGTPVRNGDGIIGSLIAYENHFREHPSMCSDLKETERFLGHLAGLIEERWAFLEEAKDMAEEINHSFEELYLYSKIATQIKTLKFSGSMQKELIEDILGIMRVDLAFAEMPNHKEFNIMAAKPEFTDRVSDPRDFIDQLLNSMPRDTLSPKDHYIIINNSKDTPGLIGLHPDPYRFLAVKMQHKNDLYGWLGLVSFNLNEIFRQSELSLLVTMAEQIAVVIANTDLYNDLERFVINVVKSLVYVIEAKDEYTRGHSERVNHYSMLMAERLNMGENEKKDLHWASILHDIGKIGIPEAILNKPGRLDNKEFSIIKSHPVKGYEILQPIEQLRSSLEGILHHHERYDGNGYPHGLRGERIPFPGRIIAVADTFDAITSDRAYRRAKTPEEAMAIMKEVSGSQLDPELVILFQELMKEGLPPGSEG